jgi:phosphotriesterase-related protein
MTVSGPIPPDRIGFTLPHEHTGIALWHNEQRSDHWELTPDEDLVTEELRELRRRGGGTLVDLTLDGVGRDPLRLRRLAGSTGLNIVMGCGWFRGSQYPAESSIDRRSVDDLAAQIVGEFENGVGGSGIRPGIIGEIGTDKPWISAIEERVHRAAARAAVSTGMAITTHGIASRVVIGHADSHHDIDFYLAVLAAGANLEFDLLGHRFGIEEALEPRLVETIVELLERGFASQLLLSQDVSHNRQLKVNGGFGYVYLQQHFLPTLRTAAVGEGEIRTMTIDNPARILGIA